MRMRLRLRKDCSLGRLGQLFFASALASVLCLPITPCLSQERQAQPARQPASTPQAPLRIDAVAAKLDVVKPNGESRARDLGRVTNAMGFGVGGNPDQTFTLDQSEEIIRALETSKRSGTLYDAPTMMLGLRQTPRYFPDGTDYARLLVDSTVQAALGTDRGTQAIRVCNVAENCNPAPVVSEELESLIVTYIPISRDMAPNRAFVVRTDTAAVMGYIAAMNNPQIVTGTDRTPAQYLADQTAASLGGDVVRGNRGDMRGCISESEPTFDLAACAKVGAQAAIYNIAQTGEPFVERNPMRLIRLPDDAAAARPR